MKRPKNIEYSERTHNIFCRYCGKWWRRPQALGFHAWVTHGIFPGQWWTHAIIEKVQP